MKATRTQTMLNEFVRYNNRSDILVVTWRKSLFKHGEAAGHLSYVSLKNFATSVVVFHQNKRVSYSSNFLCWISSGWEVWTKHSCAWKMLLFRWESRHQRPVQGQENTYSWSGWRFHPHLRQPNPCFRGQDRRLEEEGDRSGYTYNKFWITRSFNSQHVSIIYIIARSENIYKLWSQASQLIKNAVYRERFFVITAKHDVSSLVIPLWNFELL